MGLDCLSVGILVADHLSDPIPRVPGPGELVICRRLPISMGGCASNAAMDLARLGVRVGVVGCVGRDPFGRFVAETLAAAGVETSGIRILDDAETASTIILNVVGEDRRFIHATGANDRFVAGCIPLEQALTAKVVYVGGYLLMKSLDPEELAAVFRQLRGAGVKTVLDVALPEPGDAWARLAPVLPETDVFLPNRDEAELITGLADPVAQADRFREAGAGTVVITCGGQGSVLVSAKSRLQAGVYAIDFVGGTGSGDAFDAGFIAGILAGEDAAGCLRWGSAVGASCVRSVSATDSVFTRREAQEFMAAERLPLAALAGP